MKKHIELSILLLFLTLDYSIAQSTFLYNMLNTPYCVDSIKESRESDSRFLLRNFSQISKENHFKIFFGAKFTYNTTSIKNEISPFEYSVQGGQFLFSFGTTYRKKRLSLGLFPVLQIAEKRHFSNFSLLNDTPAIDKYYSLYANWIDSEDHYIQDKSLRVFPGLSFISYDIKKIRFKISTENNKWGFGRIHNLILGGNSPGYPHFSIESIKNISPKFLHLDFQVVSGLLNTYPAVNLDTSFSINGNRLFKKKDNSHRVLNAINFSITPSFLKGVTLGLSRSSIEYSSNQLSGISFSQLFSIFKRRLANDDALSRDQYASLFFRLHFDSAKFEVYGEFARNDFSYNVRDFVMTPSHSNAFMIGLTKRLLSSTTKDIVSIEYISTQLTNSNNVRDEPMWYSHYRVRQGYTNYRKYLGSYIGVGSNALALRWSRYNNRYFIKFSYDRIVNNTDLGKYMFGTNSKSWITNSFLLQYKSFSRKSLPLLQVGLTYHRNYQWNHYTFGKVNENLFIPYVSALVSL